MPSELEQVARGLLDCLDEAPEVAAQLQRTAGRCRDNAAVVVEASRGEATTAALQLDAAARACEEAAHYLAMAPLKGKLWAERLVGGRSRTGHRPDAGSAKRNKATGGVGDVADRDEVGRVTRTSAVLEGPGAGEPPLIRVARAALRTVDELHTRAKDEPVEVEIVVADSGEVAVSAQVPMDSDDARTVEIEAEGNKAAAALLQAMEEHGRGSWHKARLAIEGSHVTARFEYDRSSDEAVPAAEPMT
jgi:hypothetical protein